MISVRHQLVHHCCWMLSAFILILPNSLGALEWIEKSGDRLARLSVKSSERNGFKLLDHQATRVVFVNRLSRQLVAKTGTLPTVQVWQSVTWTATTYRIYIFADFKQTTNCIATGAGGNLKLSRPNPV